MNGKRLLIDTSKCIGCRGCQIACQQWHSLPAEDTSFTGTLQNPADMSGANLTVVKLTEVGNNGDLRWLFFKDQCRHCEWPHCTKHCPFDAIERDSTTGIITINPDRCNPSACGWGETKPCQKHCPYDIPKYNYVKGEVTVPTPMRKCDFCYDRFIHDQLPDASKKPSCEVTCPPGAISSGDADAKLAEAQDRVNYLKTHGFPYANIYPSQRMCWGPTHVIWVLTESPSKYGVGGMGMHR